MVPEVRYSYYCASERKGRPCALHHAEGDGRSVPEDAPCDEHADEHPLYSDCGANFAGGPWYQLAEAWGVGRIGHDEGLYGRSSHS